MFSSADAFNQPIGDWDTSNVTNMYGMFSCTDAFNQPIGDWDTSSVTSMASMFSCTDAFNQPIGDWDTSSVTTMKEMFKDTESFDQIFCWWIDATVDTTDMFTGSDGAIDCDQPTVFSGDSSVIIFPGDIGLGQLVANDGNGLTDGSYFTISLAPLIGQASIDLVSGAWVYTSNASFIGLDTFEVTVTDDDGFTSQQTISITITAPNSHPVINIISPSNDHLFLTGSQSFLALANDAEDGVLNNIAWSYKENNQSNYINAGSGPTLLMSLADNNYVIRACASDSQGAIVCGEISIIVSALGDEDNDGVN